MCHALPNFGQCCLCQRGQGGSGGSSINLAQNAAFAKSVWDIAHGVEAPAGQCGEVLVANIQHS